jgi:hypothetical protein
MGRRFKDLLLGSVALMHCADEPDDNPCGRVYCINLNLFSEIHAWDLSDAELQGMLCKVRSIPPSSEP